MNKFYLVRALFRLVGKIFCEFACPEFECGRTFNNFKEIAMAQPKRKNSKQRSHKRRGANRFAAPQLSKEKDGTFFMPHHVNPATGMYRGRQVVEVE
ncbi:MAG: 50S ribosomal protein L32 [Puniceicoccales bacterium]|nr:50S ribosomal protein L32 [Puniceicoccales bacterium]